MLAVAVLAGFAGGLILCTAAVAQGAGDQEGRAPSTSSPALYGDESARQELSEGASDPEVASTSIDQHGEPCLPDGIVDPASTAEPCLWDSVKHPTQRLLETKIEE